MMLKVVCLLLAVGAANAVPGIFDSFDTSLLAHAPILPAPILPAPIFKAPIIAPPPIIKAPIILPPPIIKAPILPSIPIFKPPPIIKSVAPASSYATVTKFNVVHPIVKTVVAPPPIIKTIALPPPIHFGHGFH